MVRWGSLLNWDSSIKRSICSKTLIRFIEKHRENKISGFGNWAKEGGVVFVWVRMWTSNLSAHPQYAPDNETQTNKRQVIQKAGVIDIIYNALAHHSFVVHPGGSCTYSAWSHLLLWVWQSCVCPCVSVCVGGACVDRGTWQITGLNDRGQQ